MIGYEGATGGTGSRDGFTLLEMIVVMTVLALVSTIAISGFRKNNSGLTVERAARSIAAIAMRARTRAISTGDPAFMSVNVERRSISVSNKEEMQIPAHLNLEITAAQVISGQTSGRIRFAPDGSSTGADISISDNRGDTALVAVDWMTGNVTVKK